MYLTLESVEQKRIDDMVGPARALMVTVQELATTAVVVDPFNIDTLFAWQMLLAGATRDNADPEVFIASRESLASDQVIAYTRGVTKIKPIFGIRRYVILGCSMPMDDILALQGSARETKFVFVSYKEQYSARAIKEIKKRADAEFISIDTVSSEEVAYNKFDDSISQILRLGLPDYQWRFGHMDSLGDVIAFLKAKHAIVGSDNYKKLVRAATVRGLYLAMHGALYSPTKRVSASGVDINVEDYLLHSKFVRQEIYERATHYVLMAGNKTATVLVMNAHPKEHNDIIYNGGMSIPNIVTYFDYPLQRQWRIFTKDSAVAAVFMKQFKLSNAWTDGTSVICAGTLPSVN